jgi:hypothetical protein
MYRMCSHQPNVGLVVSEAEEKNFFALLANFLVD